MIDKIMSPERKHNIVISSYIEKGPGKLEALLHEPDLEVMQAQPRALLTVLDDENLEVSLVILVGASREHDKESYLQLFRTIQLIRNKARYRHIPILFLAFNGNPRLKLQCLSAGITEYQSLPVRKSELLLFIRNIIHISTGMYRLQGEKGRLEDEIKEARIELEKQNIAQEAQFELSRQELLEANRQLKDRYESEIKALTEKNQIEAIFGRYVSPEIVDRVMDPEMSRELDGARRLISVFFADIRGFTAACENIAPEKVILILNEYFTEMTEIIRDCGGWVDKYTGDNIMALFGAPVELENHARQALSAAVRVQKTFRILKREWQSIFGTDLGLGIGIATGEAIIGNIGSFQKISYTAIGDTVNVAARLESVRRHGNILFNDTCFAQLGPGSVDHYDAQFYQELTVKGKTDPLNTYVIEIN